MPKRLLFHACIADSLYMFCIVKNKSFEFLHIIKKNVYFCKSK